MSLCCVSSNGRNKERECSAASGGLLDMALQVLGFIWPSLLGQMALSSSEEGTS